MSACRQLGQSRPYSYIFLCKIHYTLISELHTANTMRAAGNDPVWMPFCKQVTKFVLKFSERHFATVSITSRDPEKQQ